jgi:hypothetical protein
MAQIRFALTTGRKERGITNDGTRFFDSLIKGTLKEEE